MDQKQHQAKLAKEQKQAQLKTELNQLATKIGELEQERDEHTLVIDSLKAAPKDRKCWRLIGGVLTEQNAELVLGQVEQNKVGIQTLMKSLGTTYAERQTQLTAL